MSFSPQELSDQDFLASFIAEYLDGELPPAYQPRFAEVLKSPGHGEIPEHFQAMRGKLQLSLQSYYMKESELQQLKSLVQDPSIQATQEQAKIAALGRKEIVGTIQRRALLIGLAAAVIALLVWQFAPSSELAFKPLEYLGYEALALEEDPEGRLDLPTHDIREIRQYLVAYPGLEFKPRILKDFGRGFRPEGATVIDYEVAKVATVVYENPKNGERLFHFSYAGQLGDLPPVEKSGNISGKLVYQAYASDQLNFIAWQQASGLVSILAGRRGAVEMAEMAVNGDGAK